MFAEQPDPISLASVHLQIDFQGTLLATGSGFVIRTKQAPILVTAKHNLTGRELDGRCKAQHGGIPNTVTLCNFFGRLAESVPLYAGGNDPNADAPRYLFSINGGEDVALLPLPPATGRHAANVLDDSLWRPETYRGGISSLHVADACHVIGYPEGLTNVLGPDRFLPLWKTGHLANDPSFDFNREKVTLIDATTRPGMSGAPVFVVRDHAVTDEWRMAGAQAQTDLTAGGRLPRRSLPTGPVFQRRNRLVGVYSGRTSETSFIGKVWKPEVVHEILSAHFEAW